MTFNIDCLGASREVGRSAFMIETDKKIIMDYGIKIFDLSGQPKFPIRCDFKPDFAVLSHAHLDHSGCLPALYRENKIRWYSTPPTKDICEVLWLDSMKIMGEGLPYGVGHLNKALKSWSPLLYGQTIQSGETKVRLTDAGHISGSSMVDVQYKGKRLLYTGDFKCEDTYMHKGAKLVSDVDVLIIESTYAKKEHPERKQIERQFMDEIEMTVEEGGTVLLPAFALGRTQELISVIRKHNQEISVYVDGMGRGLTDIYLKYPKYLRDAAEFKKHVRSVRLVQSIGDRKAAVRQPGVIISTAGMLNGGPMLEYLFNVNSKSKLIFTGYCVEGTNGHLLQQRGCIMKEDHELQVDLPVEYMDFSAHAGRTDLLKFIKNANPNKIVLIHGDNPEEFAEELRSDHGFDATAPALGERLEA